MYSLQNVVEWKFITHHVAKNFISDHKATLVKSTIETRKSVNMFLADDTFRHQCMGSF